MKKKITRNKPHYMAMYKAERERAILLSKELQELRQANSVAAHKAISGAFANRQATRAETVTKLADVTAQLLTSLARIIDETPQA